MLNQLYRAGGGAVLAFYAAVSLLGWEFNDPVRLVPAPPVNAAIARTYWTRYGVYRIYTSSSGTRSGAGGWGFGGK